MIDNDTIRRLIDAPALMEIAEVTDYCSRVPCLPLKDDAAYLEAGRILISLRYLRRRLDQRKLDLAAGVTWTDKEIIDSHYKAVIDMVAELDGRWAEEMGDYYRKLKRAAESKEATELRQVDRERNNLVARAARKIVRVTSNGHGLQEILADEMLQQSDTMVAPIADPLKPAGLTFGMTYHARVADFDNALAACMVNPDLRKLVRIDTDELGRMQFDRRGQLAVNGIDFEERYRPRMESAT